MGTKRTAAEWWSVGREVVPGIPTNEHDSHGSGMWPIEDTRPNTITKTVANFAHGFRNFQLPNCAFSGDSIADDELSFWENEDADPRSFF